MTNKINCSTCLVVVSSQTKSKGKLRSLHNCTSEQLEQAEKLRHAKNQLKMSFDQPIRIQFFKNKIQQLEQAITEEKI